MTPQSNQGRRRAAARALALSALIALLLAAAATVNAAAATTSVPGAAGAPQAAPKTGTSHRSSPPSATIQISSLAPRGAAVPQGFLGLSFEAADLHHIAGYARSGDLVQLLRSLGPGVLRFGGLSADLETAWLQEGSPPPWAQSTIVPADLAGLAELARETGWRVLLTVNFGRGEAGADAQEVALAHSLLGEDLLGVSIGNEPDRYVADGLRPAGWALANYLAEAATFQAAIAAAAPSVPIAGPDIASGELDLSWIAPAAAAIHPALLTDHFYPLDNCGGAPPTIAELLGHLTHANEASILAHLGEIARLSELPLRIDETNDIACHGESGVSNVFASALWAIDYLSRVMQSGISGVNMHDLIGQATAYSPLVALGPAQLARGELHASPEWYALLMARLLVGERPLGVRMNDPGDDLTGAGFIAPNGSVRILVDNMASQGSPALTVRLRMPKGFSGGSILRLSAPSEQSSSGVTLGGSAVSASGTWTPERHLPRTIVVNRSPGLQMPAGSAAIVTLYPAAAAGAASASSSRRRSADISGQPAS